MDCGQFLRFKSRALQPMANSPKTLPDSGPEQDRVVSGRSVCIDSEGLPTGPCTAGDPVTMLLPQATAEFMAHYHSERNHQGFGQCTDLS
jgi:hypothetical protein